MKNTEAIDLIKKIETAAAQEDKVYLKDLEKLVYSGKKLPDPDEYIDLLLGMQEEYEDVEEEIFIKLIDFITETYC